MPLPLTPQWPSKRAEEPSVVVPECSPRSLHCDGPEGSYFSLRYFATVPPLLRHPFKDDWGHQSSKASVISPSSYQAWESPLHSPTQTCHPLDWFLFCSSLIGRPVFNFTAERRDSSTLAKSRRTGRKGQSGMAKSIQSQKEQILNGTFLGWSKGEIEGKDPGPSTKIVSRHP